MGLRCSLNLETNFSQKIKLEKNWIWKIKYKNISSSIFFWAPYSWGNFIHLLGCSKCPAYHTCFAHFLKFVFSPPFLWIVCISKSSHSLIFPLQSLILFYLILFRKFYISDIVVFASTQVWLRSFLYLPRLHLTFWTDGNRVLIIVLLLFSANSHICISAGAVWLIELVPHKSFSCFFVCGIAFLNECQSLCILTCVLDILYSCKFSGTLFWDAVQLLGNSLLLMGL